MRLGELVRTCCRVWLRRIFRKAAMGLLGTAGAVSRGTNVRVGAGARLDMPADLASQNCQKAAAGTAIHCPRRVGSGRPWQAQFRPWWSWWPNAQPALRAHGFLGAARPAHAIAMESGSGH